MGKISDALKKVALIRDNQKKFSKDESLEILTNKQEELMQEQASGENNLIPERNNTDKSAFLERTDTLAKAASPLFVSNKTHLSGIDLRIVTCHNMLSPISEQYRILRSRIKTALYKEKASYRLSTIKRFGAPKTFVLTSSLSGEGKSITAVNLAVVMAKELESKVLLIDADLRKGIIHKLLNLKHKPGLGDVLSKDFDYSVALHPTAIKNLFVIPRGETPSNPSELLDSNKMRAVLEQLKRESLTYIIIDTPPLFPFADANILGAQTDGLILIVQANRTRVQIVAKAKEFIKQSGVNFLGFVLTQTEYYMSGMYGYYNYYSYQNGNGDKEE